MFLWRLREKRRRGLTLSLLEVFCDVDDFLLSGCRRTGKLADCEMARNERVRVSSAQVR